MQIKIQKGEFILQNQNYDIYSAARNGDTEKVLDFVNLGFDIDEKNKNGHSVLMISAYAGHYDLCKILIEKGADINSVDSKGNSIIMGVVFKGYNSVFDLFVTHGVNLEYINPNGQTCLDLAVMFGRRELIFKINQQLKTNRSNGRLEQVKAWVNYVKS